MNFYLKLSVPISLTFLLLLLVSCSSQTNTLTPEESLQTYVDLLARGDLNGASVLKYDPFKEWIAMKEALVAAIVFGLISVIIRLTGLNPFSTMINCALIENYVSPENRKYILGAVLVLMLLSSVGAYKFLSGFTKRLSLEIDVFMTEGLESVVVEGTIVEESTAYVDYVLTYTDGQEVRRRAELKFQEGMWRVRKL